MNAKYSFYNLISQYNIEIPVIQRDYAQGRQNSKATSVRETVVKAMINAVTNDDFNSNLFFDFVYGRIDDDIFIPFDGQQRLTTLYLFHRYIFEQCNNEEQCEYADFCNCIALLKRFSYKTRQSTREFCEKLSRKEIKIIPQNNVEQNISTFLKNQSWFYSDWNYDPTIEGMLCVLDEIHKQFKVCENQENLFRNCAEKLTSGCSCPITFQFLDMDDNKLPDNTYVKMNARGKTLTAFENFKANMEQYLEGKKDCEKVLIRWRHSIDTEWLDLFWKIAKEKSENTMIIPDKYIMSFLNRHFMNVWRSYYHSNKKEKELDELNKITINVLLPYPSNDTFISFDSIYKLIFEKCGIEKCLEPILNFLDVFLQKEKEIRINCCSVWERCEKAVEDKNEKVWNLITGTKDQRNNSRETYPSRIAFYAVILYFAKNNEYDADEFKRWMRVVWNVIENSTIDSSDTYMSALQLIEEISEGSSNIYVWLKDVKTINSRHGSAQVEEEIDKAKQIEKPKQIENNKNWETIIEEAEATAFFKGTIRFLFTERNGQTVNWDLFEDRFKRATEYFDTSGVKIIYRQNARLICTLISLFTKWEQACRIQIGNESKVWSYIVKNKILLQPLVDLLDLDEIPLETTCNSSNIEEFEGWRIENKQSHRELAHIDMCDNKLIYNAINIMREGFGLKYRRGQFALYPNNANADWKKYVIGNKRNKLLAELTEESGIKIDQKIGETPYFWGWDIAFTWKDTNFVWRSWEDRLICGEKQRVTDKISNVEELKEVLEELISENKSSTE